MLRQLAASGFNPKAQRVRVGTSSSIEYNKPRCWDCLRDIPTEPPTTLFLEHGVDRYGMPWIWEYGLRRAKSTKFKEPNDCVFKKLEDLRITPEGDLVFDPVSHVRKPTPHELSMLWDKKLRERIVMERVDVPRPAHLVPGKSLEAGCAEAKKPFPGVAARDGCDKCGCPPTPAGCQLMPIVSDDLSHSE